MAVRRSFLWSVALALLGLGSAAASEPDAPAPAGADALAEGDLAWCTGRRGDAADAWRQAARGGDAAVTAMAEIRLVQVTGTWGLLAHGPRADRALRACATGDPWCDLAQADYEILLMRLGLPGDRQQALAWVERASAELPAAGLARKVWLGEARVSALDAEAQAEDGLAAALVAAKGQWPQGPGTWTLGLAAAGAPGLGVGGGLRFAHPDLFWRSWFLEVEGGLSSRGNRNVSAKLQTAGSVWLSTGGQYSTQFIDSWAADNADAPAPAATTQQTAIEAWAAPGVRRAGFSVWAGPLFNTERAAVVASGIAEDGDAAAPQVAELRGSGLVGGLAWQAVGQADPFGQRPGTTAQVSGRSTVQALGLADHHRTLGTVTLGYGAGMGRTFLASRVGLQLAEADFEWHLPAAGGGTWLRGAPAGRFRGPTIAALAIEARRALNPWLQLALFAEGVDVGGLHGDLGAGVRLALPPRPLNTLRLDVAISDVGWAVTGGIGQPF